MLTAIESLTHVAQFLLMLAAVVGAGLLVLAVLTLAAVILALLFFGSYGAMFLRPKSNAPQHHRDHPATVR